MPELFIIAGPNGAGKTTASFTIIPETFGINQFVNADEIARGLSPFSPESVALQSGRIMLNRIKELIQLKSDFAFETTLALKSYQNLILKCQNDGYRVNLIFLYLESPELAIERVKGRVKEGGHHIAEDIIRRRYFAGLKNFIEIYSKIVDKWMLLDNSKSPFIFVAEKSETHKIKIYQELIWKKIIQS